MSVLADERWRLTAHKEYPPERDLTGTEPRIGVFLCHCGKNIGGVANIPEVVEYAKTLSNVVHVEDSLYTCSVDTQVQIKRIIEERDLNRVVVASCTPRTHEPLFRNTCREAGLNEYLFEMANIRDQNTWVHMAEPEKATKKAKDLVRMAVAKARLLEPLKRRTVPVHHDALVIGGGISGMTAALNLADQSFAVHLVEQEKELGGQLRHIHYLLGGEEPQKQLTRIAERVQSHPRINVYTGARLTHFEGSFGNFRSKISSDHSETEVKHGAVIVATGAEEYKPAEYLYGQDDRVMTQRQLEEKLANNDFAAGMVVMIQCVGSREKDRPYCSRVCCSQAIKNALRIRESHPETDVFILYRDIRTYGFREQYYTEARQKGVRFIRYDEDNKPDVSAENGRLQVSVVDATLNLPLGLRPDVVVLATAIVPRNGTGELARMLKVPLTQDKFFLEAHMKLRPSDFASEGIFLCGLAHSPKSVDECISQASAAASRAATIIAKDELQLEATISQVVDENCDGCAYCIDPCPYNALTLVEYMSDGAIKKTVETDESKCKGCGVCQATCPKKGILIRGFRLEQISAMVDAALEV
jgi:heterodisulfide reductase subunit A